MSDLAASLAYYRGLGFGARPWSGGGEDAEALAQTWVAAGDANGHP